jgi:hypothetical protein
MLVLIGGMAMAALWLLRYWGYDIPNDEVDAMARLVLNQSESYLAEAEKIARESGVRQQRADWRVQQLKWKVLRVFTILLLLLLLLLLPLAQAKQVTTKAVLGFPRDQILLVAEDEVSSFLANLA